MLQEEITRLAKTMTNKRFDDIDTIKVFVIGVNAKLTTLKN